MFDSIINYHVVYSEPGQSDRSAMPLGNGEVCISAWMNGDGVLNFYATRTDAITELDRTVKLGMVRLSFSPSFTGCEKNYGRSFRQELIPEEGLIRFSSEGNSIELLVDSGSPAVFIRGRLEQPTAVIAEYISWRSAEKIPVDNCAYTSSLRENPDIVESCGGQVVIYHANGPNCISHLARAQGLEGALDCIPDALTGRVFGGALGMPGAAEFGPAGLKLEQTLSFDAVLATHAGQFASPKIWKEELNCIITTLPGFDAAKARTSAWWQDYWKQSFIYVRGDTPRKASITPELDSLSKETNECNSFPSAVTAAYVLTRFMTACNARGAFPIYYNGQLFNLMPGGGMHLDTQTFTRAFTLQPGEPNLDLNPDERSWCVEHLWQNLRLPYYSMLGRGEFEPLRVLFRYFRRFWNLNRERARRYHNAQGQHNTEMTLSFGLQSEGVYGDEKSRAGLPLGYALNRWGGAIDISPGLELAFLQLDYYAFTGDEDFFRNEVLPYAKDLMKYAETRFPRRDGGKIVFQPLQSLETYFDTRDPAPVVAGFYAITRRLLQAALSDNDRAVIAGFLDILPDLPRDKEREIFAPACEYDGKRRNVETPELYALYPFRLTDGEESTVPLWQQTFDIATNEAGVMRPYTIGEKPGEPSYSGWQTIGSAAAILGRRELCAEILENNCALKNPGTRFPAMWGPAYDAVPDTDHGANILNLLQLMLLRVELTGKGSKIHILPAVPLHWDVWFKLHAPQNTWVELWYEGGKLKNLTVDPPERQADVIIHFIL